MGIEAKVMRCFRGIFELLHRPFLAGFGVVMYGSGSEPVEERVIGGVYCYQLTLQVGGEFGDLQTCIRDDAFDLVGIGLAFRRLLEVDDAAVPTGQLNADIAQAGHPFADVGEGIERRLVAQELG
jgi:hypothetical protein